MKFLCKYLALAVLVITALTPFQSVHAIEYGGFGGRPAYPDPTNPRTESIFVHTLSPGEVKEDGIRVVNNSDAEKTFLVYATDSTPSTGGAFACAQQGDVKVTVGSWIALASGEVVVPPGRNEIVPFTISIPENAAVGEHNGCILVQEKKDATGGAGVNIAVRTGLRVVVTVPGQITRKLSVVGFVIAQKDDDSFLLKPQVRNEGNVSIDANVNVETKYFFGIAHAMQGGQYPVLRGEVSDWNFELPSPFWGGWYVSHFELSYDADSAAGVGVGSGKEPVRLDGNDVWFFATPQPLALAIELGALLFIIALIAFFIIAHARRRYIREHWVTHRVVKDDDVQTLASEHSVSWKLLAKVNDLEPPYALKKGDTIKVPPNHESNKKHK